MEKELLVSLSLFNSFLSGAILFVLNDLRRRIERLENRSMGQGA